MVLKVALLKQKHRSSSEPPFFKKKKKRLRTWKSNVKYYV